MKLMDHYNDEEFAAIIASSYSYAECLKKIGYSSNSGDATNVLRKRIKSLNLNISHFDMRPPATKRTEENVFCKDSTANQSTLRRFYLKKYPMEKCSICGIFPIWNDKPMTLILDHINGSNHDNRLENLRWVCPNCNSQLDTTNARNPNRKKYYCENCGKPVCQKGVKLCQSCFKEQQKKTIIDGGQRKVERPSRDKLKELIRIKPFTQIGTQFGVSDNAIRKWCDDFNLPRKKSEINAYSNEEWANI